MTKNFEVINGNSYEELKKFPDSYFDSVVTDPPYGLGKEPDATEMLKAWVETGYMEVKGSGFMGKEWDAFVPQPLFWKEVFRVLKPGGHIVAFYGTRTYDWGVMAMRLAGFEIRDCIQWVYGSGFPKSYNVAKGIEGKVLNGSASWNDWKKLDGEKEEVNWGYSKSQAKQGYRNDYSEANKERIGKVNYQTEQAKQWEGWGSALKPANEPIVLARKPLEKGLSIAENVLKWGVGGINIDGCRVSGANMTKGGCKFKSAFFESGKSNFTKDFDESKGRFPANFIMTHHSDCIFNGVKKIKSNSKEMGGMSSLGVMHDDNWKPKEIEKKEGYADENGEETIEDWNCHPDCPIKIMDEQSGESISRIGKERGTEKKGLFSNSNFNKVGREHNDSGRASRFFYVAKASKSERNFGLDDFDENQSIGGGGTYNVEAAGKYGSIKAKAQNFHPTVKPVKLIQYLAKMITPPNGKILDPFNGSGTTGIASVLENFNYTGIELDEEYCKITKARISAWNEIEEYKHYKKIIENKEEENKKPKFGTQTNLFK